METYIIAKIIQMVNFPAKIAFSFREFTKMLKKQWFLQHFHGFDDIFTGGTRTDTGHRTQPIFIHTLKEKRPLRGRNEIHT